MKIQNQQQFSWLVWTRGNINTVTHLCLPILNYLAEFKFKTKVRSWITYAILCMDFLGISETDLLYITLIKSHQILKFCITIQLKKVNRFEHDIIKSIFFSLLKSKYVPRHFYSFLAQIYQKIHAVPKKCSSYSNKISRTNFRNNILSYIYLKISSIPLFEPFTTYLCAMLKLSYF